MLSEKQHIDDFFRKKEEAFATDNHLIDAHWQQMKTQLHEPGTEPEKYTPGNHRITKIFGLLAVVAVIIILAINPFRSGKRKSPTKAKQQTTVAVPETKPVRKMVTAIDSLPVNELKTGLQQSETEP